MRFLMKGNPAVPWGPVAFRPRLATGLAIIHGLKTIKPAARIPLQRAFWYLIKGQQSSRTGLSHIIYYLNLQSILQHNY